MKDNTLREKVGVSIRDARVEYNLALQDCTHEEAVEHHDYMLNKWISNLLAEEVRKAKESEYARGWYNAWSAMNEATTEQLEKEK